MPAFAPRPTYGDFSAEGVLQHGFENNYFNDVEAIIANLGSAVDSFGSGTIFRELTTPRLADVPPTAAPTPLDYLVHGATGRPDRAVPNFINDLIHGEPGRVMSKEEVEAQFPDVPFEEGMTEARAAAIQVQNDVRNVRGYLSSKAPVGAFIGQFAGQATDPINYIPLVGPGAKAIAIARAGSILGRVGVSAADAALNTAIFGVATSGVRAKFGDDVSFNAMMLEIGMSALIGGAFGALGGVFSLKGDAAKALELAKANRALDNVQTIQDTALILGDGVQSMATTGTVDFTARAQQAIQRTAAELTARVDGERILATETASLANVTPEAGRMVVTAEGSRVEVRPEVVEASTLIPSQTGARAAPEWIAETGPAFDPALMSVNVEAGKGAPLVGPDGRIEAGQPQKELIDAVYNAGAAEAQRYRDALEANGFSTEGMERPILIQRRTTDLSDPALKAFLLEAEGRTSQEMSPLDVAAMDAGALGSDPFAIMNDGPVGYSPALVEEFANNLPRRERALVVNEDDSLTPEGQRRIENALVIAAYTDNDPDVMRQLAEANDPVSRSIIGAMADVSRKWHGMRREVATGNIRPEMDPTPAISEAARRINEWVAHAGRIKRSASDIIRHGMAAAEEVSGIGPDVRVAIKAFFEEDTFTNVVERGRLAEHLSNIVEKTWELGQPKIETRPGYSIREVIQNASTEPDASRPTAGALGFPEENVQPDGVAAVQPAGEGGGRGAERAAPEAAVERVATTMAERFAAAGRNIDEARAAGQIIGSFYESLASRIGVTVDALMARFELPIVRNGEAPGAAATAPRVAAPADQVEAIDARTIGVDARRFQFKDGGDEKGVTDRLQDVQKWDPRLAGTVLVWRDADGKNWVADGHQRVGLANRLMDGGHPPIKVNAFVLDVAAGISDVEARSIAAAKNIAEGTGSAVDAAKVLRAAKESGIDLPPLPPRSTLVRDGKALSSLSDEAFGAVINEVVPPSHGAVIGRLVSDADQQVEAVRVLAALKPDNLRQVEMVVRDMLASGTESMTRQGGLFGAESFASSVTLERAKIADEALKILKQDKRTFGMLIKEAERIETQGNVLSRTANEARLTTDEKAADVLTKLAFRAGPISDALTVAARKLKAGEATASVAARDFLGAVRDAAEKGLEYGDAAGGEGLGPAGGGEGVTPRDPDTVEMFQSAPPVGSMAFRNWFGDSKVVDADGKPQVVYHGTNADIEAFDPARLGEATGAPSAKMGFFFASNPKVASSYAEMFNQYRDTKLGRVLQTLTGGRYEGWNEAVLNRFGKSAITQNANVMPVYLRVENPKIVDFGGSEYRERTYADIISEAKAAGHDGVILRNTIDEGFEEGGDAVTDVMVAFEPTQIKSQFNRGTFDQNDPRILYQGGQRTEPGAEGKPQILMDGIEPISDKAKIEAAAAKPMRGGNAPMKEGSLFDLDVGKQESLFQPARGSITLGDKPIITLFEGADPSTALHESAHLFLSMVKGVAEGENAPATIARDWQIVRGWWDTNAADVASDANKSGRAEGVTAADVRAVLADGTTGDKAKDLAIDVGFQEQWARGFETYLREGTAPDEGLRGVFEQFKRWLMSVYKSATDLGVNLTPELREVFDRLLVNKSPLDELGRISEDGAVRIEVNGKAGVVESHMEGGTIRIDAMRSESRGGGRAAMEEITKHADGKQMPITVVVSEASARTWYESFGFVVEDAETGMMRRPPLPPGRHMPALATQPAAEPVPADVATDAAPPADLPPHVTPGTRVERQQEVDDLLRLADEGDIEAIKASPILADVTAQMNAIPETHAVEGYGSVEWAASRAYVADGKPLVSVLEAIDYLSDNARGLAAKELGIGPYEVARERKAVIVIGPPAAGKSTIANYIAVRMKAAIPDADEAKKIMPEYQNGIGANATHEESSDLATAVLRNLMDAGDNLVIPKVGGKAKSISGLADVLKEQGYKVDVVLMNVEPKEAFRRMIGRYVSTGRLIPPKYFDEIAPAPARVYEELKATGAQDGYASVSSERGLPPILSEASLSTVDYKAGDAIQFDLGTDAGDGRGARAPATPEAARIPQGEVSLIKPKVEPLPEGLAEADARVGKREKLDDTAKFFGVDAETGRFVELDDLAQIKEEGRLTADDEAVMKTAEEDFDMAKAYGKALDAAVACVL